MLAEIRPARMTDVPAIENLIHESVSKLGSSYYSSKQIESALIHIFGVDTRLILDETYFVAELNGEIAGAGGWSKRRTLFGGDQTKCPEPDPLLNPATDAARIRAFYVHPNYARRGIGGQILTACETAARIASFQRVELVSTLPGEPLYLARGYVKVKQMQLETPDGESLPAFLMTKALVGLGD